MGKKWMIIFQDTNPLSFIAMPGYLYVSKTKDLDMNSVTILKKSG